MRKSFWLFFISIFSLHSTQLEFMKGATTTTQKISSRTRQVIEANKTVFSAIKFLMRFYNIFISSIFDVKSSHIKNLYCSWHTYKKATRRNEQELKRLRQKVASLEAGGKVSQ